MQITIADIELALSPTMWDLGNKVLYDLCRQHPKHQQDDEIIAKIWFIGRSYSASIERRKNKTSAEGNFYEKVVVEKIKTQISITG